MDRTTRPLCGRALVFNTRLVGRRRRRTHYCYRPFGPDATLVDPWSEGVFGCYLLGPRCAMPSGVFFFHARQVETKKMAVGAARGVHSERHWATC
jgi:hypothetical protein